MGYRKKQATSVLRGVGGGGGGLGKEMLELRLGVEGKRARKQERTACIHREGLLG